MTTVRDKLLNVAREIWALGNESVQGWLEDRAPRKGAALAFYTVFSLAPILILSITIAGFFFGEQAARGEIVGQIRGLIGQDGAHAIQGLIESAARPGSGLLPAVVGIVTLLLGATTALAELKDGLDQIWRVPPERRAGFWYTVRKRLLSIGLILALGFLLLVSLIVSAALAALSRIWGGDDLLAVALRAINFLLSFALVTALFATIYKVLPAVSIAWRDVIVGAVVTAVLFSVGKFLIGTYIGNSGITSAYGAAGSVILVLVWVYYSAQIFLLGAEFTRIYTYRLGSRSPRHRSGERSLQA